MSRKPGIDIRKAVAADAAAIARVHAQSWRTTYAGIVPDDTLDSIDVREWEQRRRDQLANSEDREFSYVAVDRDQIVGWAVGGPERSGDVDFKGELYAIYLLEEYQRRGIGRQLTEAVVSRLVGSGMGSILIWVLADNAPARHFYEAIGGQFVREQDITIGGASLVEVAYGWKDISVLVATSSHGRNSSSLQT